MSILYSGATPKDLPHIQQLLNRCKLPADDVSDHLDHFRIARKGGQVIGVVGLEIYGSAALLRSLAVDEPYRDAGVGNALYMEAESHARAKGIKELSLLTTTAEVFFARRGFQKVEKDRIAGYVRQTKEFRLFCPSTAVCMSKLLKEEGR